MGEGETEDSRGMIKKVEGVQNLGERDVEFYEGRDFGLYDGSVGSGVFRSIFLVCHRSGLFRSVNLLWKGTWVRVLWWKWKWKSIILNWWLGML